MILKNISAKSLVLSIVIVLVLGAAVLGSIGFIGQDRSKDMKDIEKVIYNGVDINHSLSKLPDQFTVSTKDKIPDEIKKNHYNKITQDLSAVYSGKSFILTQRIQALQNSIDIQETQKFRSLGGGVEKIENVIIDVNGNEAKAEANIRTWSKTKENNGITTNPKNTKHYIFNLTKEDGKWKIINEDFTYLPGQEP